MVLAFQKGHALKRVGILLAVALLTFTLLLGAAGEGAFAQSEGVAPEAAPAGNLLGPGLKALQAGKADAAVKSFTTALSTKGLGNSDLSQIYYYRGLAYLKSKKSAQAIADLTNALWLKGLSPEEAADALRNRGLAYQAAGLADRAKIDLDAAAKAGASGGEPALASQAGNQQVASASTSDAGWTSEVDATATTAAPATAATNAKTAVAAATAPPATWDANVTAASAAPSVSFAGSESAQAAPPAATETGTLGGFFSSIFGGGNGTSAPSAKNRDGAVAAAAPDAPEITSSTAPVPAAPATPDGGWDQVQVAAASAQPEPVAASVYALQLASLRSPEEARSFIAEVQRDHGDVVGAAPITLAETTLGNMGRFYQVRMGPFADERTTLKTCTLLQRKGIDCFMITQ